MPHDSSRHHRIPLRSALPPLFAAAALAGCQSVSLDQKDKLAIDPPDAWDRAQETGAYDGQGWIDDFEDPLLPELVAEALERNRDLQAAAARLAAARAAATIAGADLWPDVSADTSGRRSLRPNTGGTALDRTRTNTFALGASMAWELDLWGRLRDRARAGYAEWQASAEDYRAARLSIAAQVARDWYAAIAARAQLELAEKTYRTFQANLEVAEESFRRGISSALDLRLLRANVATAQSQVEQRRRQLDEATRALEILLGRYPARELELAETLPRLEGPIPVGLPSELLLRRPDVIAAERRLAAAEGRSREAWKARLPSVRLTGSYGTNAFEIENLIDDTFRTWNVAYNIAQPLFQAGRLSAQARQAKANYEVALATYAQTALDAFSEAETEIMSQTSLAGEAEVQQVAMEESLAAEELAWGQYQRGLVGVVTVLDAQRRSFNAQQAFIQVSNLRLQSRIDLYVAIGGGFEMPPPPQS